MKNIFQRVEDTSNGDISLPWFVRAVSALYFQSALTSLSLIIANNTNKQY